VISVGIGFGFPECESKMFPGFRSRCTIPFKFRAFIAHAANTCHTYTNPFTTYGYFRHTVWQYSSLEKDIMLDMLPGRWTEGRPKMLWMENITSRTSLMTENITMEDRLEWRRIIQDVINPPSKDDWRQDKTRLIHGVSKKVSHLMLDNNFGKCIPIFKILSQIHSWENSLCTYLVKVENSKMWPNFYIECDN